MWPDTMKTRKYLDINGGLSQVRHLRRVQAVQVVQHILAFRLRSKQHQPLTFIEIYVALQPVKLTFIEIYVALQLDFLTPIEIYVALQPVLLTSVEIYLALHPALLTFIEIYAASHSSKLTSIKRQRKNVCQ
jgi:hypothetical protein